MTVVDYSRRNSFIRNAPRIARISLHLTNRTTTICARTLQPCRSSFTRCRGDLLRGRRYDRIEGRRVQLLIGINPAPFPPSTCTIIALPLRHLPRSATAGLPAKPRIFDRDWPGGFRYPYINRHGSPPPPREPSPWRSAEGCLTRPEASMKPVARPVILPRYRDRATPVPDPLRIVPYFFHAAVVTTSLNYPRGVNSKGNIFVFTRSTARVPRCAGAAQLLDSTQGDSSARLQGASVCPRPQIPDARQGRQQSWPWTGLGHITSSTRPDARLGSSDADRVCR